MVGCEARSQVQPIKPEPVLPLTPAQRGEIYNVIHRAMLPDDKYPSEVIRDTFGNDEDRYLRAMAGWHGVKLGEVDLAKK